MALLKKLNNYEICDDTARTAALKGFKTAGTGNAYTVTVPGITSLANGVHFTMIPHVVSTSTAPTLNVNGLGAKTILSGSSSADWLVANKPIEVVYDGANWVTIYNVANIVSKTELYPKVFTDIWKNSSTAMKCLYLNWDYYSGSTLIGNSTDAYFFKNDHFRTLVAYRPYSMNMNVVLTYLTGTNEFVNVPGINVRSYNSNSYANPAAAVAVTGQDSEWTVIVAYNSAQYEIKLQIIRVSITDDKIVTSEVLYDTTFSTTNQYVKYLNMLMPKVLSDGSIVFITNGSNGNSSNLITWENRGFMTRDNVVVSSGYARGNTFNNSAVIFEDGNGNICPLLPTSNQTTATYTNTACFTYPELESVTLETPYTRLGAAAMLYPNYTMAIQGGVAETFFAGTLDNGLNEKIEKLGYFVHDAREKDSGRYPQYWSDDGYTTEVVFSNEINHTVPIIPVDGAFIIPASYYARYSYDSGLQWSIINGVSIISPNTFDEIIFSDLTSRYNAGTLSNGSIGIARTGNHLYLYNKDQNILADITLYEEE